jgi:hypothetical protein
MPMPLSVTFEHALCSVIRGGDVDFRLSVTTILDRVRDEVGEHLGKPILIRLNNRERVEGYNGTLSIDQGTKVL